MDFSDSFDSRFLIQVFLDFDMTFSVFDPSSLTVAIRSALLLDREFSRNHKNEYVPLDSIGLNSFDGLTTLPRGS